MTGVLLAYCRACRHSNPVAWPPQDAFACVSCGKTQALIGADRCANPDGSPAFCPACGCADLFIRKDFNLKLGIALTGGAAALSLILWAQNTRFTMTLAFLVLFLVVALDAALYALLPLFTTCYRCGAFFKGMPVNPAHGAFKHADAAKWAYKPLEENLQPMEPPAGGKE